MIRTKKRTSGKQVFLLGFLLGIVLGLLVLFLLQNRQEQREPAEKERLSAMADLPAAEFGKGGGGFGEIPGEYIYSG